MKEEQSYDEKFINNHQGASNFPDFMDYPVLFGSWQRDDQLCIDNMVLSATWVGAYNLAFSHLFVCTLCPAEYLFRNIERPIEQEGHYAAQRQLCSDLYYFCACSDDNGQPQDLASVFD